MPLTTVKVVLPAGSVGAPPAPLVEAVTTLLLIADELVAPPPPSSSDFAKRFLSPEHALIDSRVSPEHMAASATLREALVRRADLLFGLRPAVCSRLWLRGVELMVAGSFGLWAFFAGTKEA